MTEPRVSFWGKLLRPRLSLRVLMLGILVSGGGLGWYVGSVRRQARIVAEIGRLGGEVMYDFNYRGGVFYEEEVPPRTQWLIDHLGVDAVSAVTSVSGGEKFAEERERTIPIANSDEERMRNCESLVNCLIGLPRLENIYIEDPTFNDSHLARLAGITRMREVEFSGTRLTGACLAHLKRMTLLETLTMTDLKPSDQDLAHIAGLTNLKGLWLDGRNLTDAGLAHLAKLTKLEKLDLCEEYETPAAITSRGLSHLSNLRRLRSLTIGASRIESLGPLALLQRLEDLKVPNASLTDEGLDVFGSGFDRLGYLNLSGNRRVTDAGLVHLRHLKKLQSLDLSGTAIQGHGLVHLAAIPGLEILELTSASLTDEGLSSFHSGFLRLGGLDLSSNPRLTDAGLAHLSNLPNVWTLRLSKTGINGSGLDQIAAFSRLSTLDLDGSGITDQGLARFKSPPRVRYLYLEDTKVSEAGLVYLLHQTFGQEVFIHGSRTTPAGLASLRARFPQTRFHDLGSDRHR